MPRICLVVLIGLPGAGKSSLCDWLLSQQSAHRGSYTVHLCYDDFLDTRLAYKDQRAFVFRILQQLISAIHGAADWPAEVPLITSSDSNADYIIMCDDNFYYRSMRYKLHQLCRSEGCIYGQIYVASSLMSCLQNNSLRSGNTRVPDHVIRQMEDRLEVPSAAGWECDTLTVCDVNSEATRLSVVGFLNTLWKKTSEEMTQVSVVQSQPHTQSGAHRLDLLLRARIKTIIEGLTEPGERQEASGRLNGRRKQILTHFRAEDDGMQTDLNCYVNLLN